MDLLCKEKLATLSKIMAVVTDELNSLASNAKNTQECGKTEETLYKAIEAKTAIEKLESIYRVKIRKATADAKGRGKL